MRLAAFIVTLGLVVLNFSAAWGAPVLVVEQDKPVSEKPVPQGEPALGVFNLKNAGDEALEIVKVSAG
jgi:copper(I)-binding protein